MVALGSNQVIMFGSYDSIVINVDVTIFIDHDLAGVEVTMVNLAGFQLGTYISHIVQHIP